jgi:methionine synthase I (cobalamin-dependent)
MLKTDIDTLYNYCQTNKEFNNLCYNMNFFNKKLVDEGSIPIMFDNIRSMDNLKHIVNEYGEMFNTKNIYIILYKLVKLAEHDAKMALLVNQIEKERKYLSSFGSMNIELGG